MARQSITEMKFSSIYPALIAKAQKKGRSKEEVDFLASWLTGWSVQQIDEFLASDRSYGEFFDTAPHLNEKRDEIRGKICGVQIETIDDPLMQNVRRLDRLVDLLAKGKPIEKILPPENR